MIVEQGILPVVPGREAEFEAAMAAAKAIISSMPGFRRMQVSRGIERPSTYLLVVEWDRLEDHTDGFRGSPEYELWRAALHHFYEPFPTIEHFTPIVQTAPTLDKM